MHTSLLQKTLFSIRKLITSPGKSLSWVHHGHLLKDRAIIDQTFWFKGVLPRTPLKDIIPETKKATVTIPHAFERTFGTSITAEEACHLAAITQSARGKKVLEIGTYDGNTALLFAANAGEAGSVVTVDLPPDFDPQRDGATLGFPTTKINVTPRDIVAGQYQGHPLATRITQVYADSTTLDWNTLGGPFDLIFIDGCHKEQFVRADTQNALKHLTPGGILLWHDYGMSDGVTVVVDELSRNIPPGFRLYALEGTRLALGIKSTV